MSYRQIRKVPGMDGIVKDLAEKQQRAQAEQGIEDVTLFRQNRVDTDAISHGDEGGALDAGLQKSASGAVSLADLDASSRQDTGQFSADGDFFCGNGAAILEADKPQGAFAAGTGNFDEPGQPAVADFCDAG